MASTISERVIQVIAATQKIPVASVSGDSTFAQLGIDSLDGLNILFALEEEFGLDVPDDVGRQFTSVGQIVEELERLLARKES